MNDGNAAGNASVTTRVTPRELRNAKQRRYRMRRKAAALERLAGAADDAVTIWRRGLLFRALDAKEGAAYEAAWKDYPIDWKVIRAAQEAAAAWARLALFLEEHCK